jgi:tRNA modification GTPase
MPTGGTIAAPATPPGRSPRALLRVSGPECDRIADERLIGPPPPAAAGPCSLRLDVRRTLPVLAWRARAPRSFTGEDTLELSFPGNPELARRVLASVCAVDGVRPAGPGEFSARAYLNARLTLDQAEGVAALVHAATAEHLEAARELLSGRAGRRYRGWADRVLSLLSLVEAGIDFTDEEDVRPIAPGRLAAELSALAGEIASFLGAAAGREPGPELPVVVLAGAPNAGKSTLFNALLGRRRAVASPLAGTTRDALQEPLGLGSGPRVLLTDLPGLDDAPAGRVEARAQAAARAALAHAAVVLWCDPEGRFDPGAAPPAGAAAAVLRVRTMADRAPTAPPGRDGLCVCALDGRNLDALRLAIADAAYTGSASARVAPRHALALHHAADDLRRAADHARDAPELVAHSLRSALRRFEELAGRLGVEDVLGRIFSTFCIGK